MERNGSLDRIKLESEYYALKFEDSLLDIDTDGEWMAQLAGHEFDERWLGKINELVGIGSPKMHKFHKYEHDIDPAVLQARTDFFEDVLGWGDEEHPLHKTYQSIKSERPTLIRLSSFIGAQRVYASRGIDVASIARFNNKILVGATEENAKEKIEHMESLGLDPKAIYEGSIKTFGLSKERIAKTLKIVESIEGLDAQTIINKSPGLLVIDGKLLRQKIRYLLSIGVKVQALNRNSEMLYTSMEHMTRNVQLLEKNGLDAGVIFNRSYLALGSSTELLEQRIQAIRDMGLDPSRVLNANATLINCDPALVRSKLLLIKSILRYFGSDATAEEVASNGAMILTRNKQKLRSTARILKEVAEPEYMSSYGAQNFDFFAMKSMDAHFSAIAEKRTDPDTADQYVTITEIRRKDRQIPPSERRTYNLNLLVDPNTRQAVGARTIAAYLAYQPLTEKEAANYPELAELHL